MRCKIVFLFLVFMLLSSCAQPPMRPASGAAPSSAPASTLDAASLTTPSPMHPGNLNTSPSVSPTPTPAVAPDSIIGLMEATMVLKPYSVYLVGEGHANVKTYEAEIQLLQYFNQYHGVRNVMLETGFCDAMLLNQYLKTNDVAILDVIMKNLRGSAAYTVEHRAFFEKLYALYQALPMEQRFTIYGVDIQHQYRTGLFYLQSRLDENAPASLRIAVDQLNPVTSKKEAQTKLDALAGLLRKNREIQKYLGAQYENFRTAVKSMQQGIEYYIGMNEEYREQCFTDNFFNAYTSASGKWIGFLGSWHTYLSGWPNNWAFPNVAQNIAGRLGTAENGIASICCTYTNSFSLNGDDTKEPLDTVAGQTLSVRSSGKTAFFLLDPQDASKGIRELAKSHSFAVSITDSAPATRYR